MIDELGRYMLRQLPGLISRAETALSEIRSPTPEPAVEQPVQLIGIEDASNFIQHMAALEGQLRLDTCAAGCTCQMQVTAWVHEASDGVVSVSVSTAHQPFCPALSVWKDADAEGEQDGSE